MWMDFWDFAFTASSVLLALLFGVTLGNLVHGLPLDANGYFLGTFASLLNPYSVIVGILAVVALTQHGLAYVADHVEGPLGERALRSVVSVWWLVLAAYVVVTAATVAEHRGDLAGAPLGTVASAVALASLVAVRRFAQRGHSHSTFWASIVFLAGLLVAATATMYPYLLRPYPGETGGLTIFDAAPPALSLAIVLVVALVGVAAVVLYSLFVRRRMSGKVSVAEEAAT
jgi:cytochrome d ubiquinol oxidase subunit II